MGEGGFKVPEQSLGHWGLAGKEFGCVFCLFFVFLFDLSTWLEDPSSPSRDGTWAP